MYAIGFSELVGRNFLPDRYPNSDIYSAISLVTKLTELSELLLIITLIVDFQSALVCYNSWRGNVVMRFCYIPCSCHCVLLNSALGRNIASYRREKCTRFISTDTKVVPNGCFLYAYRSRKIVCVTA